jgi:hypothetical protein
MLILHVHVIMSGYRSIELVSICKQKRLDQVLSNLVTEIQFLPHNQHAYVIRWGPVVWYSAIVLEYWSVCLYSEQVVMMFSCSSTRPHAVKKNQQGLVVMGHLVIVFWCCSTRSFSLNLVYYNLVSQCCRDLVLHLLFDANWLRKNFLIEFCYHVIMCIFYPVLLRA